MPILNVTLSSAPDAALAAAVAGELSRLTAALLGKNPQVTAVAVGHVDPAHWFVAGQRLSEIGKASFFLDTRITDGTNTKDEKAAYVAAVFEAMARLLGPIHEESYVHVHDVRGDAYGYGGKTQDYRYIAAKV
ncbi:MAG: tautomerase family protein [Ferrovibrionaceae bacterium]